MSRELTPYILVPLETAYFTLISFYMFSVADVNKVHFSNHRTRIPHYALNLEPSLTDSDIWQKLDFLWSRQKKKRKESFALETKALSCIVIKTIITLPLNGK